MITISVFKNIHYGQAIEAMLGERMSVVQKLKFVDQSGSRKRSPKNTRSEITPLEWELGKRPHNEEQRRPSRAFYRQHKEQEEHNNMRGIQSRVTGHESPHEQVTFSRVTKTCIPARPFACILILPYEPNEVYPMLPYVTLCYSHVTP